MKPFLRTQSEKYAERLENLESLLSSQDIMADMKAFRDLSKEHADVTPVAGRLKRYEQVEKDVASAREMLADADMAEMAQEEIASGEAELVQLEGELQRLHAAQRPRRCPQLLCGDTRWHGRRRVGAVCRRFVPHVHPLCREEGLEGGDHERVGQRAGRLQRSGVQAGRR